jgi:LacI family gluconate utilization system Gnt-I transcriptional repressor
VCGFGDFELGRGCVPTITTVRVDGAEMGRLAAERLLERINANPHAPRSGRQTIVPFDIVARDST